MQGSCGVLELFFKVEQADFFFFLFLCQSENIKLLLMTRIKPAQL